MEALEWLNHQSNSLAAMAPTERPQVVAFCALWTYFEHRVLGEKLSGPTIRALSTHIVERADCSAPVAVYEAIQYFRAVYVVDGRFTPSYQYLRLDDRTNIKLVRAVLLSQDDCLRSLLICALTVIRRCQQLLFSSNWKRAMGNRIEGVTHVNLVLIAVAEMLTPAQSGA
jgi:hypothetical protein